MPDSRRQKTEDRGQQQARSGNNQSSAVSPQSSVFSPPKGTLLAFDFGTRRIGIAKGGTLLGKAAPLATIDAEKNETRFARIAELILEWQPSALVVGLPCNDDGTPHQMTALSRRFANRLKGRFNLPVMLVDERYTSAAASSALNEQGVHGRKQKVLLDQYAAQQILQAYFDEPTAAQLV
ncbi:MAG: Holliday junction resolvase RuvX [Gallionella sp.]|jgi:putative Holliday junction resolvase|nr:Holliday junction resolvase RuvX [Gallionella sp.]